jgi:hypothetical protein
MRTYNDILHDRIEKMTEVISFVLQAVHSIAHETESVNCRHELAWVKDALKELDDLRHEFMSHEGE